MLKIRSILIKLIFVFVVPLIVYVYFIHVEENVAHAWFWATIVGIGNIMLWCVSPSRTIAEKIRGLDYRDWVINIGLSLFAFFYFPDESLFSRFVKLLCLLVGFSGLSVFQNRIHASIARKIHKIKDWLRIRKS
jgi:hypothetical protein